MQKPTILITGCGYKPISHVYKFNGKSTHDAIPIDGVNHKMNIGTATTYLFAKKGLEVIMISRDKERLEKIKQGLVKLGCDGNLISYMASNIATQEGVEHLVSHIPKNKVFYWVQSLGIGGGTYKVPNDNIYLPFEKISPEIIKAETDIVVATHMLVLKIIPILRKQIKNKQKAKIAIITSMSGERGYHFGATHVAAKHALVGYIKGIEKELQDEGIEIYDIRPGAIDTGMYDNPYVRKTVEEISLRTKMWGGEKPIYASPINVAKAIYKALFGKSTKRVYRILAPKQK